MLAGHVDQEADLVLPRTVALVMVQMARVVANLVDQRGNVGRQPIVFLKIDGEVGRGAAADFGQRLAILRRIDGNPNHARPGLGQLLDLGGGRLDVGGLRGAHALHHDRSARRQS